MEVWSISIYELKLFFYKRNNSSLNITNSNIKVLSKGDPGTVANHLKIIMKLQWGQGAIVLFKICALKKRDFKRNFNGLFQSKMAMSNSKRYPLSDKLSIKNVKILKTDHCQY